MGQTGPCTASAGPQMPGLGPRTPCHHHLPRSGPACQNQALELCTTPVHLYMPGSGPVSSYTRTSLQGYALQTMGLLMGLEILAAEEQCRCSPPLGPDLACGSEVEPSCFRQPHTLGSSLAPSCFTFYFGALNSSYAQVGSECYILLQRLGARSRLRLGYLSCKSYRI